jgi:hypothetical protein
MAALSTISTVVGLIGSVVSAAGTIAAGAAQKQAKDYEASQLEMQALEERAAAQREAQQSRRERDLLLSRQQAVAATSNLGALDETVLELSGDVARDAAVNEGMILYGGEERAKGRRAQAVASRLEGRAAQTGAAFSAAGTILGGIGSFANSYMKTPPKTATASYRYG